MNNKAFINPAIALIVVALVALLFVVYSQRQAPAEIPEPTSTSTSTTEPLVPKTATEPALTVMQGTYGALEGSLSYPSEVLPDQMVCAYNVETLQTYCTSQNIQDAKYTYLKGYVLEVPAGKYEVYAELPSGQPGRILYKRAYYSEFVTCGLQYDCPSHAPIVVNVPAGQTVTTIDPQDWYDY